MGEILWIILIVGIFLLSGKKKEQKGKGEEGTEQPEYYRQAASNRAEAAQSKWMSAKPSARRIPGAGSGASQQKTKAVSGPAPQTDIVARAKANAARLKADETLKEIEEAHGHSEKEEAIQLEHSRNCQSLKKAEELELAVESQLGSTEDLIVKGYSGNLSFERDFLGEAMDMLNAISAVPGQ